MLIGVVAIDLYPDGCKSANSLSHIVPVAHTPAGRHASATITDGMDQSTGHRGCRMRSFRQTQGGFAFVPSMTTSAKTNRYKGCRSERSMIARMIDKATKTKTATPQGFLMTGLLQR